MTALPAGISQRLLPLEIGYAQNLEILLDGNPIGRITRRATSKNWYFRNGGAYGEVRTKAAAVNALIFLARKN